MIVRIWTTGIDPTRLDEYRRFAVERSLPMFKRQQGFLGVLFTEDANRGVTVSLWTDREATEALERSTSYRATVEAISSAGFLTGRQDVERLDVAGGHLAPDVIQLLNGR